MAIKDFLKGKKQKGVELVSPGSGVIIPLSEVSDQVFSQELVGKGFALRPSDGKICSPVDGTVAAVFDTKHALGLQTDGGMEVLVHMGLDTVEWKGSGFEVSVSAGAKVKKGDLLAEMNLGEIEAAGYQTVTPVIVSNSDQYSNFELLKKGAVTAGEPVYKVN